MISNYGALRREDPSRIAPVSYDTGGEVTLMDVQNGISGFFGIDASDNRVTEFAGRIFGQAREIRDGNGMRIKGGQNLSTNGAFISILFSSNSTAESLGLKANEQQKIQALTTANVHGSEFVALAQRSGLSLELLAAIAAARGDRAATDSIRALSAQSSIGFGPYRETGLPISMMQQAAALGVPPSAVANAGNYLSSVGFTPEQQRQFAGHFVGTSEDFRNAFRRQQQQGGRLTDDHIKSGKDVAATIAAIRAGKLRKEDAPPSVQEIMADMARKGIDPSNAPAAVIQGYFKDNPQALAAAKAANAVDIAATQGLTQDAKNRLMKQASDIAEAPAPKAADPKAADPKAADPKAADPKAAAAAPAPATQVARAPRVGTF